MIYYLVLRRKALRHPQAYRGDYYRELPGDYSPAEAGYFVRLGRTAPEDITATILDLARREHLRLEEYREEKGLILKRSHTDYRVHPGEGRDKLAAHEIELFNFLFQQVAQQVGGSVTFKEIEAYARRRRVSTAAFHQGWGEKLKQQVQTWAFSVPRSGPHHRRSSFVCRWIYFHHDRISVNYRLVVTFTALLLVLTAMLKNPTPYRADHYAKWKAFKRFCIFPSLNAHHPALRFGNITCLCVTLRGQTGDEAAPGGLSADTGTIPPGRLGLVAMAMTNPASFNNLTSAMQQSFRSAFSSSSLRFRRRAVFLRGGGGGGGGGGGALSVLSGRMLTLQDQVLAILYGKENNRLPDVLIFIGTADCSA